MTSSFSGATGVQRLSNYGVVQKNSGPVLHFDISLTDVGQYQYFFVQRIYKDFQMFAFADCEVPA